MKSQSTNIFSLNDKRQQKVTLTKSGDLKAYLKVLSMSELLGENQKLIIEIQNSCHIDFDLKLKSKLILKELKNRLSGEPFLLQKKFHILSKQHEELINSLG